MTQDEWRALLAETLAIAEELERIGRRWRTVASILAGVILAQIVWWVVAP